MTSPALPESVATTTPSYTTPRDTTLHSGTSMPSGGVHPISYHVSPSENLPDRSRPIFAMEDSVLRRRERRWPRE